VRPDNGAAARQTHTLRVMGTVVVCELYGPPAACSAVEAAGDLLRQVDARFSTWDPWSPMSRLRRRAVTPADLPEADAREIGEVLTRCAALVTATGGWFDPWAVPGGVDPTGMVKGWAVQRSVDLLARHGLTAMVNGGGDIAVQGVPVGHDGWRIGIRHPWRADALAAVVELSGDRGAVATSGAYERGAHLVDPWTGRRTRGAVASATVVGPDLAVADAVATAVAVGGRRAATTVADGELGAAYELYLIGHDGSEWWTPGFPFAADVRGTAAGGATTDHRNCSGELAG